MKGKKNKSCNQEYEYLLQVIQYQGNLVAQLFTTFLVVHSIFIGFFSTILYSKEFELDSNHDIFLLIINSIGLLGCFLWFFVYKRNLRFYSDSLSKILEMESELKYSIFSNQITKTKLSSKFRSRHAYSCMIIIFILFYLFNFYSLII